MAYRHGDHNVICDRCGYKKKASQCQMTWDKLFVCSDTCWEVRQPQDFVRAKQDDQTVHPARSESTDVFLTTYTTADDL